MRIIVTILSIIFCSLFAKSQTENYTQNDLIEILKESINSVLELNHDDSFWKGSINMIMDNKSIPIDSIFLMVDNIPKEVTSDNIPLVTPFYLYSLSKSEFPEGKDSVMMPGIVLDTECYLKGNYCQIIVFESIIKAYIETYAPSIESNIYYNNRIIKLHHLLYEFNCETHSWEKLSEFPGVIWMDYDINNVLNTALYESIMDFMSRLKALPGVEYSSFIVSDDAVVTNPNPFWNRLTEDLRLKLDIYSEQMPLSYLKKHLDEEYDFDVKVIIPKEVLHGNKLTISITYNLMNYDNGISIRTMATGDYEYTLDCITKTWNLTKTMYNEKPL